MPNHDRFECQTAIDSDAILQESSGELTELRKRTLISLCTAINRNASLKAASRKDYYLRACLVEYAGVENLHVLCTSGLLPGVITDETGQRF